MKKKVIWKVFLWIVTEYPLQIPAQPFLARPYTELDAVVQCSAFCCGVGRARGKIALPGSHDPASTQFHFGGHQIGKGSSAHSGKQPFVVDTPSAQGRGAHVPDDEHLQTGVRKEEFSGPCQCLPAGAAGLAAAAGVEKEIGWYAERELPVAQF